MTNEKPHLESNVNSPAEKTIFEAFGLRAHVSVDEVRMDGKESPQAQALSIRSPLFQWRTVEEEFRPKSPEDEYFDSDLEMAERDLVYRWQDLASPGQIHALYQIPYLDRMGERVRRRMDGDEGLCATDPRYDAYFSNKLALFCDLMTEQNIRSVLNREEVAQKREMTKDGVRLVEYFRTMNGKDESVRYGNIAKLQEISNLAKGKATQIMETRNGKRTTADDLRNAVREVIGEKVKAEMTSAPVHEPLALDREAEYEVHPVAKDEADFE